ncbi:MAG: hypothetical protein IPK16_01965 [Anaerolineales bacterium]|nr:hypothetical protein [Anaerolineales bacterium]
MRGGRYILFVLLGPTGPDTAVRFFANVAEYPLPAPQPLNSGDEELDAIAAMCETTLRACMQETFVDCVWRESSQWVGDALPEALVMSHLTDDVRPLLNVITVAAKGAYPDGVLPSVVPGEVHAYTIVDYNFMWIELLQLALKLTGDTAFIRTQWPVLQRMLDRFARDVGDDGLIRSQPGRRLFLDWAPVSRNEPNAIYNLHYLLGLQIACALAERLELAADAATWHARAENLQHAVREAFWRGARWWDDRERTTYSQLSAALVVLTQSLPSHECNRLLDAVVQRSLYLDDGLLVGTPVLASPFMHHYVFEALQMMGRPQDVIDIIRLRWGRWVKAGYPTTWENWNVDFPDGSQCHAFSAHPRHHLAVALSALKTP